MCAIHSGDYFKSEIANMEKTLTADGKILFHYGDGRRPYLYSFHPDIDTSTEIN